MSEHALQKFKIKNYLPQTLFGRSFLIIITPVFLLQILAIYIFYDRHWDRMTERLAFALVGEVTILIEEIEAGRSSEDIEEISGLVAKHLGFVMRFNESETKIPAESLSGWRPVLVAKKLENKLKQKVDYPFTLHIGKDERWIEIYLKLSRGVLVISVPESRLFSSSSYIFILWMIGLSILLFTIAMIFMRNQIRPIRRLAVAAEWFGKGRDVSEYRPQGAREVRQAARAFITMRDRIRKQMSQRTEMLAGVSHDLRTPLTRLKLEIELLEQTEEIQAMRQDIADMEQMIEGYLDFVRGDGQEEPELIDIQTVLDKVVSDAKRQGINVVSDIKPQHPVSMWIRPQAFTRCLMNLITNADQYAQNIQINFTLDRIENTAFIMVEDDGPGIAKDKRQDVFKPFFRMDESRNKKTGGVGLGLSIAQDVVLSHGGTISLDDSEMGGLQVIVRLPL